MKQWTKAIIADVALAILAIFLFSPTQLALSPLAPNILVAAASVIGAAGIGAAAVKVNGDAIKAMRAEKRLELGPGEATVNDIKMALQEYEKTTAVGVYARQAIAELEAAEFKRSTLYGIIGNKFQEGSITWEKFAEGIEAATQAIAFNSALLTKRIKAFDVEDYKRNAKNTITGLFNRGTVSEEVRQERRAMYEANLEEMRTIVTANERLLTELDRFAIEMGRLESGANEQSNDRLLEEINTLVALGLVPPGPGWALTALCVAGSAVSLVCYQLFYGLKGMAAFVDGAVPLVLAGLMTGVVTLCMGWSFCE